MCYCYSYFAKWGERTQNALHSHNWEMAKLRLKPVSAWFTILTSANAWADDKPLAFCIFRLFSPFCPRKLGEEGKVPTTLKDIHQITAQNVTRTWDHEPGIHIWDSGAPNAGVAHCTSMPNTWLAVISPSVQDQIRTRARTTPSWRWGTDSYRINHQYFQGENSNN